ncbi:hypothetical protein Lser_V15G27996 [Lactuca serriola]
MGKTRSMLRKKKYDEARSRIIINGGVGSWSDLNHDILFLVMMKLEFVDFIAFSGVCNSWRSFAVSNRNSFMVSIPPMPISISNSTTDANEKQYCLKDSQGRKMKTIVPHSAKRSCIGVTCGYLILSGVETKDFWLVNLITRHELHFPDVPNEYFYCHRDAKGKREWTCVSSPFSIDDLVAFKGKIYTLHATGICEMKLYPEPKLVLLETKNILNLDSRFMEFVTSGENLYVIDRLSKHPYTILEIDLDQMKWVSPKKTCEEYVFFRSNTDSANHRSLYDGRYVVEDKNGKGGCLYANMWYFFFDCLNVDIIHE